MRTFEEPSGRGWEVVVGRESWGALVAIFVPRDGSQDVREAPLSASSYEEGNDELDRLDAQGLSRLLAASRPKQI
jgi:hypothetical protein